MKAKVLVSACLLGVNVRYDGGNNSRGDRIDQWREEGRVVPVCPEVAGGLPVPRPPAEIHGGTGEEVLEGAATVDTIDGVDVTAAFLAGAQAALKLVEQNGIGVAVLKERSPSCGSGTIYDGSHSRTLRAGDGVTAALLRQHGVAVYGETELELAHQKLLEIEE